MDNTDITILVGVISIALQAMAVYFTARIISSRATKSVLWYCLGFAFIFMMVRRATALCLILCDIQAGQTLFLFDKVLLPVFISMLIVVGLQDFNKKYYG